MVPELDALKGALDGQREHVLGILEGLTDADLRRPVLDAAAGRPDALNLAPAVWPAEIWPNWRLPDVRHVLLHVITEVACHTGHLDAARELIDGQTWLGGSPYAS